MSGSIGTEVVSVADLGRTSAPLVFVSLDHKVHGWEVDAALQWLASTPPVVTVGISRRVVAPGLDRLAEVLTCTIGDGAPSTATAIVPDLDATMRTIADAVERTPQATLALDRLLRVTERSGLADGLAAEARAHAASRTGPEFAQWRANHPVGERARSDGPAVVVERDGLRLVVELNRPQRHNVLDGEVRDGLTDALDLALTDRTITQLLVRGRGDSFCGGSDPDAATEPSDLGRSVGARLDRLRARVSVEVHGACVGPGAELPAFAGRVVARRDAWFQVPELSMGLVPGAGGTVSLTRRIGRPRTAYLALTGARIDAATALGWGLVDSLA